MTPSRHPLPPLIATIVLVFSRAHAGEATAEATYTVRRQGDAPELEIELAVAGDTDGESQFSVPPGWGGVERIADYVHDLTFATAAGEPLACEHPNDLAWTVRHAPDATIVARWKLRNAADPTTRRGNDYRPRVTNDFCGVLCSIGMLRPDALAGERSHRFRLVFEGFDRPGWRLAHSFGTSADTTVDLPLDTFLHSMFLAGALRTEERLVRERRVVFALQTGTIGMTDAAFADVGTRIIATERDFFQDWDQPRYLVAAITNGEMQNGNLSLGGTGLTDSFVMFLPNNLDLKPGNDTWNRVFGVLAHEYFHHWNGPGTSAETPAGTSYWFSEGFTEFFTRRMLLRSGLWDAKQYVNSLNESLINYWQLPVRNANNASIVEGFWSNRDLGMLPYRRGDLVALMLDHEIRTVSGGGESLDDLMREVVARHRRGERVFTADLLELASELTSEEFAIRLRAIVIEGHDVEIGPDTFASVARLVPRRVSRGDGAPPSTVAVFELKPDVTAEAGRANL